MVQGSLLTTVEAGRSLIVLGDEQDKQTVLRSLYHCCASTLIKMKKIKKKKEERNAENPNFQRKSSWIENIS